MSDPRRNAEGYLDVTAYFGTKNAGHSRHILGVAQTSHIAQNIFSIFHLQNLPPTVPYGYFVTKKELTVSTMNSLFIHPLLAYHAAFFSSFLQLCVT